MLPLHDQNPARSVPVGTWGIATVAAGVFLLQGAGVVDLDWAFWPGRAWEPGAAPTWLTHQFLHDGWGHLLGNLLYLIIFGNNVEDRCGTGRFLAFYLLCGVLAAAAQRAGDPSSEIPMVGASGAIAGVMGAYLVLFPRVRVHTLVAMRVVALPAWVLLGFWFAWQVFLSLPTGGSGAMTGGGVAYLAHAGGFLAGLLLVRLFDRGRGGF